MDLGFNIPPTAKVILSHAADSRELWSETLNLKTKLQYALDLSVEPVSPVSV